MKPPFKTMAECELYHEQQKSERIRMRHRTKKQIAADFDAAIEEQQMFEADKRYRRLAKSQAQKLEVE